MRPVLILALLLIGSAQAQTRLELTDPLLLIDGQRARVAGAPLITSDFGLLEMEIPGWGLLMVSDAPFEGARRAGDFDQARLVLVVDGRSIRLRSQMPLLETAGPVPAFARLDEHPMTPSDGPVTLNLRRAQIALPQSESPRVERPRDTTNELVRQLEVLRTERDQLRQTLAQTQHERDDALLRLSALRDEVDRLQLEMSGGHQPENGLRAERDALREEVTRLRASLEAVGTPPALPPPGDVSGPPARLSLPGFDVSRLSNRDQMEARLQTTPYPEWAAYNRIGGDVLVLFQTDATGAVVRTAVPRPIGGGLDALAEEIVRTMRFVPVRSDGQPTRLRSQVVVRFTP
ncbi:MAG: hypothetical protein Rubg2KO_05030 [Rubricoccaceae bacterium]